MSVTLSRIGSRGVTIRTEPQIPEAVEGTWTSRGSEGLGPLGDELVGSRCLRATEVVVLATSLEARGLSAFGVTKMMAAAMSQAASVGERRFVFVSYSREDSEWLRRFANMLKPGVRRRGLEVWSDQRNVVGEQWRLQLAEAIHAGGVAVGQY